MAPYVGQKGLVVRLLCRAAASYPPATMSATFRIDILPQTSAADAHLAHEAKLLGLTRLKDLRRSRYYLVRGDLDAATAQRLGDTLLCDPVIEVATLKAPNAGKRRVIEVQARRRQTEGG